MYFHISRQKRHFISLFYIFIWKIWRKPLFMYRLAHEDMTILSGTATLIREGEVHRSGHKFSAWLDRNLVCQMNSDNIFLNVIRVTVIFHFFVSGKFYLPSAGSIFTSGFIWLFHYRKTEILCRLKTLDL